MTVSPFVPYRQSPLTVHGADRVGLASSSAKASKDKSSFAKATEDKSEAALHIADGIGLASEAALHIADGIGLASEAALHKWLRLGGLCPGPDDLMP
jgi:hypothetical protein